MLKDPIEIENYEHKAKVLRENGWTDLWHCDNWVRKEWFGDTDLNIDMAGVSTDTAYCSCVPQEELPQVYSTAFVKTPHKKGTIRRVPLLNYYLRQGTQVLNKNNEIYLIRSFETKLMGYHPIMKTYVMLGTKDLVIKGDYIEQLSMLFVDYVDETNEIKTLIPLAYPQWKNAIEKQLVDSKEIIEFHTRKVNYNGFVPKVAEMHI